MKKTVITIIFAAVAIVAIVLLFVFVNDGLTLRFGQGTAEYNISSFGEGMTREIVNSSADTVGYVKILSDGKEGDDGEVKLKEKRLKKAGNSGYFIEMEIAFLTAEITGENAKFVRFSIGESSFELGADKKPSETDISTFAVSESGEYTVFTVSFYTPKSDYYVLSISSVRTGGDVNPSFGD